MSAEATPRKVRLRTEEKIQVVNKRLCANKLEKEPK